MMNAIVELVRRKKLGVTDEKVKETACNTPQTNRKTSEKLLRVTGGTRLWKLSMQDGQARER